MVGAMVVGPKLTFGRMTLGGFVGNNVTVVVAVSTMIAGWALTVQLEALSGVPAEGSLVLGGGVMSSKRVSMVWKMAVDNNESKL